MDWNAYARTDQLTVKLYREEVTPHLDVVVDASRSMDLEGSRKAAAAVALAAFFATAGARAGYSHALWQLADACRPVLAGNRPPALWDGLAFDHRGGPVAGLPPWRPRGTRVLISDLFWLGEPLALVRPFAERAAAAVVVQLLAAADVDPPEGESVRLVDAETDEVREIHVDALVARQYRDALARHQDSWSRACRQCGAVFVTVVAETLLAGWDLAPLVAAGAAHRVIPYSLDAMVSMSPLFLYPLAFVGLVGVPALLAIYLFRNRFRRRPVSSLMLWPAVRESRAGGRRLRAVQTPLLFLLELLAILLLVLAASEPHLRLRTSSRPLVVVLDDSYSMQAGGERSARTRAAEAFQSQVRSQPPYSIPLCSRWRASGGTGRPGAIGGRGGDAAGRVEMPRAPPGWTTR
ncbi:MAG: DUF58 domain-containing protein [Gemmataceae bacterium]